MPEYLPPLSVLHAAAPGILDVVFGKDGAGDNHPNFTGPVYGSAGGYAHGWWHVEGFDGADVLLMNDAIGEYDALSLSALLPSTACRLAGLCLRATKVLPRRADLDLCYQILDQAMDNRIHPETAARMVTLTLRLAPEIAALKS